LPIAAKYLLCFTLLLNATSIFAMDECVVLLHGLWRSETSMNRLKERLMEAGYKVNNVEYESTDDTVEVLAEEAVLSGINACGESSQIHFVTHSMGGILLRQYLEYNNIENLGHVVMLGPPNQGSEVVDFYSEFAAFEWFTGPAGLQLGTGQASVPRALGPVSFDLGIIAGTQSINPILSTMLPDKDDGKVSVESTRVEGMNDHIELPVTHVFMMRNPEVMEQVIHYLQLGRFIRSEEGQEAQAGEQEVRDP
jgi:pimeloyl-ACP methyl ester carboxylesterase